MSKNKLGITEGEWIAEREFSKRYGQFIFRIDNKEDTHIGFVEAYSGTEDVNDELYKMAEANSKLLTDAGTTANKTGLLPSEILKQRDELIYLIKKLSVADGYDLEDEIYVFRELKDEARKLIQSI